MATFDEKATCISVECVDNALGIPGVIVYDDVTFPISSQQDEEIAMDCDPPLTEGVSNDSSKAPPGSSTDDDEVSQEVDL